MHDIIRGTVVDIETAPLDDTLLSLVMPEFQAGRNLKDPAKIQADLAEKEASWREKAALSALTGKVLAIGLLTNDAPNLIVGPPERAILEFFWDVWAKGGRFIGFNVKDFDFRFMTIRSRILGVTVPDDLWTGRYWNSRIIDLQEVFTGYSRDIAGYSLGAICRACGLGQKAGNGADFAGLFIRDRKAALAYLEQDLRLEAALAKRLGVL